MKLRHRFLFMSDLISDFKKNYFLSTLMIVIAFMIFDIIVTLFVKQAGELNDFYNVFIKDLGDIYRIQYEFSDEEEVFEKQENIAGFLNEIKQSSSVESLSMFTFSKIYFDQFSDSDEYAEIMEKRTVSEYEGTVDSSSSKILYINEDISKIMRLENASGIALYEYKGDNIPILAGKSFSSILKIGDLLTSGSYTFEVVGFMEEGSSWIKHGVIEISYDELQSLDYCFVMDIGLISDTLSLDTMNSTFITFRDKKVINEIEDIASKNGLSITMVTLKQEISNVETDRDDALEIYRRILIFMILLCVLTASAASMISILLQKKKIGIWYANGILPQDVYGFIGLMQFMRLAISTIMAYSAGIAYASLYDEAYKNVHTGQTSIYMLVLAIVTWIITTIVPCAYIRSKKVVDLIR